MKIRIGFVSNSSSSSFVAYGTVLDDSNSVYKDILNKVETYAKKLNIDSDRMSSILKEIEELKNNKRSDINDVLDLLLSLPGFESYTSSWNAQEEVYYIGICPNDCQDETPRELKSKVKKLFKKVFGNDQEVDYIQEGWYDG